MARVIKRKKKKNSQDVDYSTPYEGAIGKSISSDTAKKMWTDKASADELQLGYRMTKDSDGNFIVRTKLESKA